MPRIFVYLLSLTMLSGGYMSWASTPTHSPFTQPLLLQDIPAPPPVKPVSVPATPVYRLAGIAVINNKRLAVIEQNAKYFQVLAVNETWHDLQVIAINMSSVVVQTQQGRQQLFIQN